MLGSGPAGEKGAAQAAYFGKRVAVVETQAALGGAAANTGTLPSKTLRETALMLSGFRARGLYGVDLSLRREATVRDLLYREQIVVEAERSRALFNVARHGIDLIHGQGSFLDEHTIQIKHAGGGSTVITGDHILIATGSVPRRPHQFPFDHSAVFDSDTILGLKHMPASFVVVGGGVIGCEYACMFAALDRPTTLIDGGTSLLPFLDAELSAALRTRMEQLGVRVNAPNRVQSCETTDDRTVTLLLTSGEAITTDGALITAGRVSCTDALNLAAAGLTADENGRIFVDNNFRTSVAHIYAAGDVVGFPALASTSMEQARIAMVHAFDLRYKTEVAPILPYGIFTIPEVSMAGETEQSLQRRGISYVVGKADYAGNARGLITGDTGGFLKLLLHADDLKILGVHIIGEQATELVHIGLTAMLTSSTADLFIKTCYNYPTLGELYKYATYDAMGRKQRGESFSFQGGRMD